MSWDKENSPRGGKKVGEPHPDWRMNYSNWRDQLDIPQFRGTIGHCDIWEYYIADGKTYKIVIWDPKNKTGTLKRLIGNKNSREDINPIGVPTYCLLSWKDEKMGVCSCNINFHVEHDKFKNHMSHYLKIDKAPKTGWDGGLFER